MPSRPAAPAFGGSQTICYYHTVSLGTGQNVQLDSPVIADPSNTEPIAVSRTPRA